MTPEIEVTREIAAPPEAVFAAISDVTRMGEWSPETYEAAWNDGADGPALGASFTGHNRNGDNEWSTTGTIVDLVENERFFFDCDMDGFVFAKWGYAIEPTDAGCRVTEYTTNLLPEEFTEVAAGMSGVSDRAAHNRVTMAATLDRLAAALE